MEVYKTAEGKDVALLLESTQEKPSRRRFMQRSWWFLQGAGSLSLICILFLLISHAKLPRQERTRLKPGLEAPKLMKDKLAESVCRSYLEIDKPFSRFSVVLTADPGDFTGVSEAFYITSNLKDVHKKQEFNTVCGSVTFGSLLEQPVLVVTTGIGPTAAALCTQEILTACGSFIDEAIYFGTSGWSPQLGGILNPPDCLAANNDTQVTRVGDICISPFSVNWQCKKSSWSQQSEGYPNQCFRPTESFGPNATYLYGACEFYADNMDANLRLANRLLEAAQGETARLSLPRRNDAVLNQERLYWSQMSNGTGVNYPPLNAEDVPRTWDYRQCMEVDEQFFFTGVPWEIKSRDYVAATMNAAFLDYGDYTPRSSRDVIAVSAMEGVGVAEAFAKYNGLDSTAAFVPYTHLRSMANWVHHPVAQTAPGVWSTAQDFAEDYVDGYAFAIGTGSSTILSFFQLRCIAEQKTRPDVMDCEFKLKGLPRPLRTPRP